MTQSLNQQSSGIWQRYKANIQLKKSWRQLWSTPSQDLAVLDGLRGLAMMMVILLHCVYGVLLTSEGQAKIDWVVNAPVWLSWIFQARGADIIFLLSAFLVTDHCLQRSQQASWKIHHFYWRRFLRIYPLFLFALIIYLLADQSRMEYLLSNLLLMVNIIPEQKHIIPVGWSITVQAQFYFLMPILVYLLRGRKDALQLLFLLLMAANLIRWFSFYSNDEIVNAEFYRFYTGENYPKDYGPLMYYSLHTRLEPFVFGMLLAFMHQAKLHLRCAEIFKQKPFIMFIVFLLALACLVLPCIANIHNPNAWLYQPFNPAVQAVYLVMHRFVFSFGVFLITLLLLIKLPVLNPFRFWLELPAWRVMSQLIYPVYLFHMIAIFIAAYFLLGGEVKSLVTANYSMLIWIFLLTIPISILIALPLHLFLEKPFARFANK